MSKNRSTQTAVGVWVGSGTARGAAGGLDAIRGVGLETNNSTVLGFKAVLWGTCVMSVACCIRRLYATQRRRGA